MRKSYQGTAGKSKAKFEVVGERQLAVGLPLPLVEVWEECFRSSNLFLIAESLLCQ